jgi:hypothetical protein
MKTLLLLSLLLHEPEVTVLSRPYLTIAVKGQSTMQPLAKDFCDELKYNYLIEKTELQNFVSRQNHLKAELKNIYNGRHSNLTEQQIFQQLFEINKGIKEVMQRLNHLADAKFTSEDYQLNVNWSLPVFKKHQEDEYNRIANLIKEEGFTAVNQHELNLFRAGKPYTHRAYDLNYFYYAGEESRNLHQDFYVNTASNFTGVVRNKDLHTFSLQKQSSKLEICQFIPSLEIGLEVTETVKSEGLPSQQGIKQLYLKFEENL